MKTTQTFFSLLLISAMLGGVSSVAVGQVVKTKPPRVFLLDSGKLADTKRRIRSGDQIFAAALVKLEADARRALKQKPLFVVSKAATPPSGDKHDYISQAPYFWPNPKTANGLPYVRRDGERNPEINQITDHQALDRMEAAVYSLSLAYYFTDNEAYAARAGELLRGWFLDPDTRMNPNLEYAQFIPGVNTGRGIGLIETRGLTEVIDAIGLLAESRSWTAADQRGLEAWFTGFLRWMQESRNGREESAAKNNHGTYYDVQVMSFALFLNQNELVKQVAETAKQKRIASQIEPGGRQTLELERTKAWSYSNMNLHGLLLLARLAENVDVDLWDYQTKDGRSIRSALEFLYPFALENRPWTHQEIGGLSPAVFFPIMRQAIAHYPQFKSVELKMPKADPADREHLLSGK